MASQDPTIKYLYEASLKLPSTPLYNAVRSRMLDTCFNLNASRKFNITTVSRCQACGVSFNVIKPIHYILPQKPLKRCVKRYLEESKIQTKYQYVRLKKNKISSRNKQILIKKCNLCKKEFKHSIFKSAGYFSAKKEVQQEKKKLKRNKKRKNQEFAGLNISAVMSLKRSAESADNIETPKRVKTDTNVINLVTPVNNNNYIDLTTPAPNNNPKINILSPKSVNTRLEKFWATGSFIENVAPNISEVVTVQESPVKIVRNLNDMFTPVHTLNKNTTVELNDSGTPLKQNINILQQATNSNINNLPEKKIKKDKQLLNKPSPVKTSSKSPLPKKPPKTPKKVTPKKDTPKKVTPKKGKTKNKKTSKKNIVLAKEESTVDKKQKKLNSLSNFLNGTSNLQKPKITTNLQDFLTSIT